ncbi:Gfo/Idh/MocA family oxidoreductase [uncultured Castellaniella sp.]|uniref:Gfo/Idh/MocA family protein n=1 Tax=uncultured Castellaniella sp. TaxID=647907 RepID=UPI0026246707|nr:Gfo/Idh/MocA family oxidoreductase [uncultured Castellaniella sp.]
MSTQKRKSLALIGLGAIGIMHAERIRNSADFTLTSLADPSDQAREFAQVNNIRWYSGHRDLLSATHPDGVIIATPNQTHTVIALDFLSEHIPVLLEKPITDTVEDAWQIVHAERRSSTPVLIGHHRRHNPILREARRLLESGLIGEPVSATVMANFLKPSSYFDLAWHRQPGAGPVLINLIHDIDMLRLLLGEIASVQAMKSNRTRGLEVEDTAGVLMQFQSGAIGTLVTSDCTTSPWNWDLSAGEAIHYPQQRENTHFICGTQASLSLPGLDIWQYQGSEKHWQAPLTQTRSILHRQDPYQAQLENFAAVIDGAAPPRCTSLDGLRTLQAALAVHESCTTASPVTLDHTIPQCLPDQEEHQS